MPRVETTEAAHTVIDVDNPDIPMEEQQSQTQQQSQPQAVDETPTADSPAKPDFSSFSDLGDF